MTGMMRKSETPRPWIGGTVAVVVVSALLLLSGDAQAALSSESAEESGGVEAGGSGVSIRQGDRTVRAGDGCAEVEQGGQVVRAGDCDAGSERPGTGGNPERPDGTDERTVSENTVPEETIREQTNPETIQGTASETPGGTVPETTSGEDDVGEGCPVEPEGETVETTVERAVDGDTVELARPVRGSSLVRLIGVDAPDFEGGSGSEPGAVDAADFTASELEGERVLLELDRGETDPYGRLLAYLWRGPELFNLTLLEGGHAEATTVEPNDRYADCFEAAGRTTNEEADTPPGGIPEPDDGQYGEETEPETTQPEPVPPGATTSEPTLPEKTVPGGSTGGEGTATSLLANSPEQGSLDDGRTPSATSTAETPSDQYGGPDEGSAPEDGAGTGVAEYSSAGPDPALPERWTSTGPVPVLPETGGPLALPLLGALLVVIGLLLAPGVRVKRGRGVDDGSRDGR